MCVASVNFFFRLYIQSLVAFFIVSTFMSIHLTFFPLHASSRMHNRSEKSDSSPQGLCPLTHLRSLSQVCFRLICNNNRSNELELKRIFDQTMTKSSMNATNAIEIQSTSGQLTRMSKSSGKFWIRFKLSSRKYKNN